MMTRDELLAMTIKHRLFLKDYEGDEEAVISFAAAILERAVDACELERVDAKSTGHECDRAYNMAIDHCVEAIRALKPDSGVKG